MMVEDGWPVDWLAVTIVAEMISCADGTSAVLELVG
jgi:hypothetical protein